MSPNLKRPEGPLTPQNLSQVAAAVRRAMADAESKQALAGIVRSASAAQPTTGKGIDFETFLAMLHSTSLDSLDLYDDRSGSSRGSSMRAGTGALLDHSAAGGDHFAPVLQPVVEAK